MESPHDCGPPPVHTCNTTNILELLILGRRGSAFAFFQSTRTFVAFFDRRAGASQCSYSLWTRHGYQKLPNNSEKFYIWLCLHFREQNSNFFQKVNAKVIQLLNHLTNNLSYYSSVHSRPYYHIFQLVKFSNPRSALQIVIDFNYILAALFFHSTNYKDPWSVSCYWAVVVALFTSPSI